MLELSSSSRWQTVGNASLETHLYFCLLEMTSWGPVWKMCKCSGSVGEFLKPNLWVRHLVGCRQPLLGFVTAADSQKMWESFLAGDCGLLFLSLLAPWAFLGDGAFSMASKWRLISCWSVWSWVDPGLQPWDGSSLAEFWCCDLTSHIRMCNWINTWKLHREHPLEHTWVFNGKLQKAH